MTSATNTNVHTNTSPPTSSNIPLTPHPGIYRPDTSDPFIRQLGCAETYISVDDVAVDGYPKLARYIGDYPGFAIFRRFASLNSRILLYLQAEIVKLEHELHELELDNQTHTRLHERFHELKSAEAGSSGALLWAKVEEIDGMLEKYSTDFHTVRPRPLPLTKSTSRLGLTLNKKNVCSTKSVSSNFPGLTTMR